MSVSSVVMLCLSFIYLFSKCLLHLSVGRAQCKVPRIHRAKTRLLPKAVTWYLSAAVVSNMSVSKSDLSSLSIDAVFFFFF